MLPVARTLYNTALQRCVKVAEQAAGSRRSVAQQVDCSIGYGCKPTIQSPGDIDESLFMHAGGDVRTIEPQETCCYLGGFAKLGML
jgi:hypothetical protein